MDKQKRIDAITKALGYTENGGKPDLDKLKAGKSGEMKSIFQFTPATWKLYSKQVLGKDGTPLNPDSETYVVKKKVSDWYDHLEADGTPPDDIPLKIASMWNAGERRPDAYKENWKGTNKYGVEYDTPAYAKKVADYTKQFESGSDEETPVQVAQKSKGNPGLLPKTTSATSNMPGNIKGLIQLATSTPTQGSPM